MARINPKAPAPIVLVVTAIWILWAFEYETVIKRLTTDVDGVVIASTDFPSRNAPRYATQYLIRGPDGKDQIYIAGATDASLERSMPVGTRISKRRGQLGYVRNGSWVNFPTGFYGGMLGVAVGCLAWAVLIWRRI
jgi:hypothetical protein